MKSRTTATLLLANIHATAVERNVSVRRKGERRAHLIATGLGTL